MSTPPRRMRRKSSTIRVRDVYAGTVPFWISDHGYVTPYNTKTGARDDTAGVIENGRLIVQVIDVPTGLIVGPVVVYRQAYVYPDGTVKRTKQRRLVTMPGFMQMLRLNKLELSAAEDDRTLVRPPS